MTKNIPDGDQLFTGLTQIDYRDYEEGGYAESTQAELDAALATAPNGAIFGSSYYRMPFSIGLSVWNHYANRDDGFARWMTKTFGKQPVLMSWVNPGLRASVAQSVLRSHGYFHGQVSYEAVPQKNPRTAKIGYHVSMGPLFTIDTLSYVGFPAEADSLLAATADEAAIHSGDPLNVSTLDAERTRVATLLRNHGYYYYQPSYASYLADTFAVPCRAQLRFQMADGLPPQAQHKWYIGRININMRKTFMEQYTDSTVRRFFTVRYHGKKPPLRPRVIMADLKLRPRQEYSYDSYLESLSRLNAMGLFSTTDFAFAPRDTAATCDTLDLTLNCVFDKPWDTYLETNVNGRSIGRMGPELKLGVTRRNAFRGGEKIDVNVHGSYEWATSSGSNMSNYEYGMDASIEFPRIIAPFFSNSRAPRTRDGQRARRRRFYSTPSTLAKFSTDVVRRPGYYKMHIVSGEWTYRWQTSAQSTHELSPLTVKYQYMNSSTAAFDSIVASNSFLGATLEDYFVPQIRYTYTYTSPKSYRNPIRWETTVAESGNLTSLAMMAAGRSWSEKNKELFKNPYAQFVKLETDFTKTWATSRHNTLVGHVSAGLAYAYGNSDDIPFSETFYVGGANSIRAFPVRTIGPGQMPNLFEDAQDNYLIHNGHVKFQANLEYRHQLFGSLYAALFLDAGNVWLVRDPYVETGSDEEEAILNGFYRMTRFRFNRFFRDLALGTGVGLRYDLDFLVLRLDWGIGLHDPSITARSGFYNMDKFTHTLNFAIGYPF